MIPVIGVSVRALATCIALGVCLGPGLAVAQSVPIAPQFGAQSAQDPQQLQLPLRTERPTAWSSHDCTSRESTMTAVFGEHSRTWRVISRP